MEWRRASNTRRALASDPTAPVSPPISEKPDSVLTGTTWNDEAGNRFLEKKSRDEQRADAEEAATSLEPIVLGDL